MGWGMGFWGADLWALDVLTALCMRWAFGFGWQGYVGLVKGGDHIRMMGWGDVSGILSQAKRAQPACIAVDGLPDQPINAVVAAGRAARSLARPGAPNSASTLDASRRLATCSNVASTTSLLSVAMAA